MPIVLPMTPPKKPEGELAKRLRELLERKAAESALPPQEEAAAAPPAQQEALVERNEISEQECYERVMRDPSAWTGINLPGLSGDNPSILPR